MTVVNFSESDLLELTKKRKKKGDETQVSANEKNAEANQVQESLTQNTEKTVKNDEKTALFSKNAQKISNDENLKQENNMSNLTEKPTEIDKENTTENATKNATGSETEKVEKSNTPVAKNGAISDAVEKFFDSIKSNSKGDTNESATNSETPTKKDSMLDDLKAQIESIDEKYDIFPTKGEKMDDNINLSRKETIIKTDDELKAEAENSLADYAKAQKDAINNTADKKISNFDGKEESLRAQSELEKAQLQNYYNTYKRNAENDALKRGIQRSSIVINNLNAFDKELIEKLINIDKTLGENIASINDQISALNDERQKALDEFNITYAVKVNDKINALKDDLQAKNDEILEYNNKIAQIEAEYKADAQKRNQQVDEDYLSQIYKYFANQDTIKANKQKDYETAVDEYLESLSKDDALAELSNNSFIRDILGANLSYYIYKTKAR